MNRFQDKVILVTGGARGLGAAICERLASEGANVLVADVRKDLAERAVLNLREDGYKAHALHLDVTDDMNSKNVMEHVAKTFGRLDALINNAGVDVTLPIDTLSVNDWDRVIATNLRGPFLMSKNALPLMKDRRAGHIINIVSTASKRVWPNASAYHASKWGLLGFSHALHVEARQHQIKVTALVCGGMRTPFLLERFPGIDVNTLQDPADVAETVHYVLSAPAGTVIPEIMAIPLTETSWP